MSTGAGRKIGFLHTADSHVPVFADLAATLAPGVDVAHQVRPDLLNRARQEGLSEPVENVFREVILELVNDGCTAISCTCSTLGPLAEQLKIDGIQLQRIDRVAADECMKYRSILVVVALPTAAGAAELLLEQSRSRLTATTRWRVMVVPNAWALFESGDLVGYLQRVADFCNQFGDDYDALFLAQASMLGAEANCRHGIVLTSPALGVRRLLGMPGNPTTTERRKLGL